MVSDYTLLLLQMFFKKILWMDAFTYFWFTSGFIFSDNKILATFTMPLGLQMFCLLYKSI